MGISSVYKPRIQQELLKKKMSFWCVSNYDWMLKYRIMVINGFLFVCWHESNPNQFCYITQNGRAIFIEFDFIYNFCDGIVLSIAGSNVRVTNLKTAPIPPPMCHYELIFPNTVCEVVQYNDVAAFLLADHSLFAYKLREGKFEKYAEYGTIDLPENCICYNLYLNDFDQLSAIVLLRSVVILQSIAIIHTRHICLYSMEKPFIWHSCVSNGYIIQRVDGEWFSLTKDEDKENYYLKTQKLFGTGSALHCCYYSPTKDSIFGINKTRDLIVNSRSVLKNIGSYTVDQDYLLTITFVSCLNSSKLQVVELKDILTIDNKISYKTSRTVERGAMLIGHEVGGTRIWLQMPRGNLETIYLQELLLKKLKELLNNLLFKDAAIIMKKHRIDMNLFYDHNPEFFMKHIGQFVEDIGSAELLNLFIASLNNDNVPTDAYLGNYINNSHAKFDKRAEKMGKLSLDDAHITDLYTTVISTYLKEQPPQISKALSALRERSLKLSNGMILEKEWIAYISLLAPNENLFSLALSTYDLSLAHAVAQNSQMYKIDIHLGLFQRAVRNLSELDDHWNEAVEIIKRQNLYAEALAIYRGKKTYLKACELCATHLMNKRCFEEAALLFKRANNVVLALQCYKSVQNWKGVIECGRIMNMEKEMLDDLLQKMIPHFENKRNFMNIAEILSFIDKESNKMQVVEYYCKADAWDFAMNLAFGNEELTEIVSKMASIRCEQILQATENWKNLLEQYCCRLELVFSETSTTVSDMSKISATSAVSARRRKHVEKGLLCHLSSVISNAIINDINIVYENFSMLLQEEKKLKEGTQYEDAALLNALKDTVLLIDSQQDELILLLPTLVAIDAIEEARALQNQFLTLLKLAHKIIGTAWPAYLSPHMIPGPLREIYRDESGVIRFPEENNMPNRIPFEEKETRPFSESELMRPQIRNVLWQLEICS
ncbi:Elongator complex protein 1 [Dirofilaria immitis]|nr:Elongator complex protein 1 [Dirofilaria immitis]